MVKAALIVLGILVAVVVVVVAVGYSLPERHVASRDAVFQDPADKVFAVLLDVDSYPRWRSDVRTVEILSREPLLRWREHGSNGAITFERQEANAPARLVSRIADPSLPFGGHWTYALTPHDGGVRLAITEEGEVYNPLFRFMSRFVFGHTATMDTFLADLRAHLQKGGSRS